MISCDFDCANCKERDLHDPFEEIKLKYPAIQDFQYNFDNYSHPTSMLLGLTSDCNLSCPYCFVHQHKEDMSLDTAIQAVEWLRKNYSSKKEKQEMFVGFFGGEPLLRYDEIIVPLVERYKDISNITFGITTNGVLLDENKVDFCFHNNISILLSFDGIELVQNRQRPGKGFNSYDIVLKNIPYLLLRFPNTVMRATITKESIPYVYQITMMAVELGFKQITFCPNAFEDWSEEDRELLYKQFNEIGHYIYKELRKGNTPIHVNPINSYFLKINSIFKGELTFENRVLRCGLGTTSCAITPKGDIIPCQEKISKPTIILGNVKTGIDEKIHENYLRQYFTNVNTIHCNKNCKFRTKLICLSDLCPSRLEDLNYKISTSSCAFVRTATEVAVRLFFLCQADISPHIREFFYQEQEVF